MTHSSRRSLLMGLAATSLGATALSALSGCGSSQTTPPGDPTTTGAPAAPTSAPAGSTPNSPATTTAGGGGGGGPKLKVVATTSVVADFVKELGGDNVELYTVIKPNVDAHQFEPSPADVKALADAAVIVQNGAGLEKWFDKTVKSAQAKGTVVNASTDIPLRKGSAGGHDDHDDHGHDDENDPHVWHNPQFARVMVANIAKGLAAADGGRAGRYDAAAKTYTAKLTALDMEVEQALAVLTNRKLVTNHDALGYYIDRYKLEFVGSVIPSFDSQAELSTRRTAELVRKIKEQQVKAVFAEGTIPPKTAEAISRDAGVKIVSGEAALYGDSLGPDGSDAATYLGMIRHNTRSIVDNLR